MNGGCQTGWSLSSRERRDYPGRAVWREESPNSLRAVCRITSGRVVPAVPCRVRAIGNCGSSRLAREDPGPFDGKCHRKYTALAEQARVRVKRCGKSAPLRTAMAGAGQTPHGARPNRGGGGSLQRVPARCARLPGRSLEPVSNDRPRGMTVTAATPYRIRLTGLASLGALRL